MPTEATFAFGLIVLFWIGIAAIAIAATVFWIVELIDAVRREFNDPALKIVWVVVICLSHVIGSLVYYFAGKPMGYLPNERPRQPGAWS